MNKGTVTPEIIKCILIFDPEAIKPDAVADRTLTIIIFLQISHVSWLTPSKPLGSIPASLWDRSQQASGIDPSKPLGSIPASLWDLSQQASGIGPSKPQAGHHMSQVH